MQASNGTLTIRSLDMAIDRPLHTLLSVALVVALFVAMLSTTGCFVTQSDLQKAEQIMGYIVTAIPVALQLIADFQGKVPANVVTQVQSWAQQGLSAAQLASSLLAQYTAANATTVIQQVNTALAVAQSNLVQILNALHVVDQTTQAAISAAFAAIVGAVGAVQAAVQALTHKASAKHAKAVRFRMSMTAKTFRGQFNDACVAAGHPELHI